MIQLAEIEITKEDFEQCNWSSIIENCTKRCCENYYESFKKEIETVEKGSPEERVYSILGSITSLHLNTDSKEEPLQVSFATPYWRLPSLDDFTNSQLNILDEILSAVKDSELKARIADALWIKKRNFRLVEIAVNSYLESAKILEDGIEWCPCAWRLERAIQLSKSISNEELFLKAIKQLEETIDRCTDDGLLYLPAELMDILLEYRQGDHKKYADLSEKAAVYCENKKRGSTHYWDKARDYWKLKSKWHSLEKDEIKKIEAMKNYAETYLKQAEDDINENPPSYGNASFRIKSAIETYRELGNMRERELELHKLLAKYQSKSTQEMQSHTTKIDISDEVKKAKELVKGKSIQDSLFSLAYSDLFVKVSKLREQVEENAKHFPAQFMFATAIVNDQGRTTGNRPSGSSNKEQEVERAIEAEMARSALMFQSYFAQARVEPARQQINLEHNVRPKDFLHIISESPFVPADRELIYARGLQAGIQGDFLLSTHLLIPQIEYSLRHVLLQRGVVVTNLDSEGIQEEPSLNTIFIRYKEPLIAIFNEEIVFYLRTLLVERFGANLRNDVSHGLLSHDQFYSLTGSYLWWFTLHLCSLRFIHRPIQE